MSKFVDPTEVEDRVRRTLAVRAEDMAPGDGTPAPSQSQSGPDLGLVTPTEAPSPRRRHALTAALTAAAALVLVVAAVAMLGNKDDADPILGAQEPDGEDVTGLTTSSTVAMPAMIEWGYPVAEFAGDGFTVHVQFNYGEGEEAIPRTEYWQAVQAGPIRGYYAALPGTGISELRLIVEGGTVVFLAGTAPQEQVLAAAATVHIDSATGLYRLTPPPEWTTTWMVTPEEAATWGPDAPRSEVSDAVSLGSFACGDKTFGATWYGGWTEDNVPDGSKPVAVGNGVQPAFFGTIAPEAGDLFQLWIVYRDGVVEIQAAVMTEDEVIAAANGVERLPDGQFQVTPPPCFTAE